MRSTLSLYSSVTAILFALQATGQDVNSKAEVGIEVLRTVECSRKTVNGDAIKVNYRGTFQSDGSEFDNSYDRGEPIGFTLGKHQVITGWDMGLLGMCIGEQRRLTIPPELAYGHDGTGPIPPESTLMFDTELMDIAGVGVGDFTDADGGPDAQPAEDKEHGGDKPEGDGECRLLGPFALIVQGALGALALLSLVFKRWRESPRRPIKVWSFDASKQVVGSILLHVANLLMSMLSSGDFDIAAKTKEAVENKQPNPCSFYLLNLAIDTTLGIPILVILLKVLHHAFLLTPLARPPQSIKSGHYGSPPRVSWWAKQSLIYFLGLIGMKLCVFFIFKLLPWIAWVGDWALRWTEGNEAVQITFVMFIFPLIMNAMQYYIIDTFIKDHAGGEESGEYQQVDGDEDEETRRIREAREWEDADSDNDENEPLTGRETLKEANPTAVPVRDRDGGHSSSSSRSERKGGLLGKEAKTK
ncbi:hypothetical protein EJ05DRAFT_457547 [Pseudovirgaria hyperparasitica]|uniref:peptidylprolyl isomerase n=1 Tax=Pseudovirgaria hyperparasitica TaxID=470096 RepID=A0A6A6VWL4_9PEZI|nr:uncharacterized protein EJ05DRAFT_457547 [Pseudovirgaria hyperparasitica]KAF2753631.1 hypothetical protein EJ05DRAFT_457547 [Pseudovirgaria hyperparasitica]